MGMSKEFFEIRKTFVDSPINCANTNWERFFAGKDPGNLWSHTQEPDAHVKWFLKHYKFSKDITILDNLVNSKSIYISTLKYNI